MEDRQLIDYIKKLSNWEEDPIACAEICERVGLGEAWDMTTETKGFAPQGHSPYSKEFLIRVAIELLNKERII